MKIEKLVIDRQKWHRGHGSHGSALRIGAFAGCVAWDSWEMSAG